MLSKQVQTGTNQPIEQETVAQVPSETKGYEYASAQRRMLAALADITAILVMLLPVNWFFESIVFGGHDLTFYTDMYMQMHNHPSTVELNSLISFLYERGWITKMLLMHLTTFLLIAAYVIGFNIKHSATPGKILARCIIVDATTHQRIAPKQAVIRFFGYIASTLVLCLGFVFMHFTPKSRALHDYIANTVVIIQPNGVRNAIFNQKQ